MCCTSELNPRHLETKKLAEQFSEMWKVGVIDNRPGI